MVEQRTLIFAIHYIHVLEDPTNQTTLTKNYSYFFMHGIWEVLTTKLNLLLVKQLDLGSGRVCADVLPRAGLQRTLCPPPVLAALASVCAQLRFVALDGLELDM